MYSCGCEHNAALKRLALIERGKLPTDEVTLDRWRKWARENGVCVPPRFVYGDLRPVLDDGRTKTENAKLTHPAD